MPSYDDYVKPSAEDVALEEMEALNSSENHTEESELQRKQQQKHESSAIINIDSRNVAKASFFMQYLLLFKRILVCSKRNYVSRFLMNFVSDFLLYFFIIFLIVFVVF